MKKVLFILFATLLLSGEVWAGSPVSELKEGHYYRIRYSPTGHYLCWAGQEGTTGNSINSFRQPMVLISAQKALTSPGAIFKYEKVTSGGWFSSSTRDGLTAQGIEVGEGLSDFYVASENLTSGQRAASWDTGSTFDISRPSETSKKFSIHSKVSVFIVSRDAYWEENYTQRQADYPDGYLNITTSASGYWYFEEVDGADANTSSSAELKSMGSFLGFPPADYTYNVKFHYIENSSTQYGVTNDGPRAYQITDVQSGQDEDGTTWYYATMCLPFPVEVPSNVQCFFVNSSKQTVAIDYNDDNLNGTGRFAKKVNVIPAGTPFVARSQSNDPSANKFVPYIPPTGTTTVYAPTNISVNQLKNANSYLVKKSTNNNSYNRTLNLYKLSITNDGKVEFLTQITDANELTDGNRAFYGQVSAPIVYEPEEADLADLIYEDNGTKWTDEDYVKISDDLLVCFVNQNAGLVFARDLQNNKSYWDKVTSTPSNYYNFTPEEGNVVGAAQTLLEPSDYDQSNWVMIKVPTKLVGNFKIGQTIPGGNLKGYIMTDKTTPTFDMLAVENQSGNVTPNLNTYSIAHLMADANTHLLTSGKNNQDYFFMTPKPAEVAYITWAVLKKVGDNVFAYIPARNDETGDNALDFHGRVLVSPAYYAGSADDWTDENLQELEGKAICFKAAITPESGVAVVGAPRRSSTPSVNENDPVSNQHVIYPLDISPTNVIVTSVEGVKSTATVKSVKFYNLQGIESDIPFDGINIVVEHLNDGTTRSSKMLF